MIGRRRRQLQRPQYRVGKKIQFADGANSHSESCRQTAVHPFRYRGLDHLENRGDVDDLTAQVFSREPPEGHHRDSQLRTPSQNFLRFRCSEPVPLEVGEPRLSGISAMAILNESEMTGYGPLSHIAEKSLLVEPVENLFQHIVLR